MYAIPANSNSSITAYVRVSNVYIVLLCCYFICYTMLLLFKVYYADTMLLLISKVYYAANMLLLLFAGIGRNKQTNVFSLDSPS